MTTPDIIAFIRARFAEEAGEAAKQSDSDDSDMIGYEIEATGATGYPCERYLRIAKARVLAEVEAKRRLLALHDGEHDCPEMRSGEYPADWPPTARHGQPGERWEYPDAEHFDAGELCPTLRLLALPYATHPDYRPEWRP